MNEDNSSELDALLGTENVMMQIAEQYAVFRNAGTSHDNLCCFVMDLRSEVVRALFRDIFGANAEAEVPDDVAIATLERTDAVMRLYDAALDDLGAEVQRYPVNDESLLLVAAWAEEVVVGHVLALRA
jgi:hypothetical protein